VTRPDHPAHMAGAGDAPAQIDDVGEFLAHALEMEHESSANYAQLADSMEVHHNPEAAALFRRLAALSDEHAGRIAEQAHGILLPRIAPWAFKWDCPGGPEGGDCLHGDLSYQMTAAQALDLALSNESRGQAFYAHVAQTSNDAEVRRLAAEMAAEELEHLDMLTAMLAPEHRRDDDRPQDLDPPHIPA